MRCVVTYKKQTHDLNSGGKCSCYFPKSSQNYLIFHALPYCHSWITIFFLCYQTLNKCKKLSGNFKPSLQTSRDLVFADQPNFFSMHNFRNKVSVHHLELSLQKLTNNIPKLSTCYYYFPRYRP
jgi:hypothetical protein